VFTVSLVCGGGGFLGGRRFVRGLDVAASLVIEVNHVYFVIKEDLRRIYGG
jgi:hypothetical protein